MVLTKNRPEFAVTCGIRTRRRRFLTDFYEYSEGRYSRYAFIQSEARGARRIARDMGGCRPDVAFANTRYRHRITRPQREN